jgi:hypothetical protein
MGEALPEKSGPGETKRLCRSPSAERLAFPEIS